MPRARPPQPHDPRLTGRPRALPSGTGRQDAAGPQDSGDVPGYEFETPRRLRDTGGFETVRNTGEFRSPRDTGEFRAPRDTGGFGRVRRGDDFDALPGPGAPQPPRDSGSFPAARRSGGFPAARDSGEFRAPRDTGGFGRVQGGRRDTGGFSRVQKRDDFDARPGPGAPLPPRNSGSFPAARRSGEFPAVRDSGEFGAVRDPGGSGPHRAFGDSGESGAARGTGERPPLTLRYTPTVATSGPMRPVPPPAEFGDPRRPSRPQARPRPRTPARGSPFPGEERAPQSGARGRPASRYGTTERDRDRLDRDGRDSRDHYDRRDRRDSRDRQGWRRDADGRDDLDGQRGERGLRRLRHPADGEAALGLAARLGREAAAAMRSRNWVAGLLVPIIAAIAVGIAVVVVAGANTGSSGPPPSSLDAGFPPARPAAADFTDTPALAGRGIQAPLGQVATFGGTVVAVGAQSGAQVPRARFFVSANNGQTWQLGTVQGNPPPGGAAALVAGGPRGWVAVGPAAVWTSQNGRDWLSAPRLPQLAGDKITTLTATGSGFLAAGANIPGGDAAKASPVVWLSANGTTWQRLGATQLALPAGGDQVLGITAAAANGGVIVMDGTVAGGATGSGVWRSADGGTSWTAVTVPDGGGASATIAGLAPLRGGFVAVRSAPVGGSSGAAVYTSANGTAWQQSAQLRTADGSPLKLGPVSGGPNGAVVTGQAHGLDIAFLSPNGTAWTGTDPAGTATTVQVSGVALTATGQAVFAGTSVGNAAEQQPVLTLIGAQGGPRQVGIRSIAGAVTAQVAVNAVAASGMTQVAAGSADGFPALWVSTDGASTWTRAAGATAAALTRPGDEQLTGVAHGAAGWLAVGGSATAARQRPVVVGSADGRTWTALDGAAAFTGPAQAVTAAAAAGPAGYVIVGHAVAGGRTVAAAWSAPGLTGWQLAAAAEPATGDSQMNAVTPAGKGFVAVGSAGTRPAVWQSATGRTWSEITLLAPASAQLQFVAANGNTVAAAGTELTAAGQRRPFAVVSTNGGATWTSAALPAPPGTGTADPTAVTGLAAAGGGFTAIGTRSTPGSGSVDVVIWTLARGAAPGTAWTAAAPNDTGLSGPGTQTITALTGAGTTLTGVGFTASAAAEEPTIWQSPVRN